MRDYVEDVRRAAAEFPEPPILVGHSMGGVLVQRYLEDHPAPGAVLMAPVPAGTALAAAARLALHHPLAMLKANLLWSLRLDGLQDVPTLSAHLRAIFRAP